jgi:hypothetical protein
MGLEADRFWCYFGGWLQLQGFEPGGDHMFRLVEVCATSVVAPSLVFTINQPGKDTSELTSELELGF